MLALVPAVQQQRPENVFGNQPHEDAIPDDSDAGATLGQCAEHADASAHPGWLSHRPVQAKQVDLLVQDLQLHMHKLAEATKLAS